MHLMLGLIFHHAIHFFNAVAHALSGVHIDGNG